MWQWSIVKSCIFLGKGSFLLSRSKRRSNALSWKTLDLNLVVWIGFSFWFDFVSFLISIVIFEKLWDFKFCKSSLWCSLAFWLSLILSSHCFFRASCFSLRIYNFKEFWLNWYELSLLFDEGFTWIDEMFSFSDKLVSWEEVFSSLCSSFLKEFEVASLGG